jgi:hypothetical protein
MLPKTAASVRPDTLARTAVPPEEDTAVTFKTTFEDRAAANVSHPLLLLLLLLLLTERVTPCMA